MLVILWLCVRSVVDTRALACEFCLSACICSCKDLTREQALSIHVTNTWALWMLTQPGVGAFPGHYGTETKAHQPCTQYRLVTLAWEICCMPKFASKISSNTSCPYSAMSAVSTEESQEAWLALISDESVML